MKILLVIAFCFVFSSCCSETEPERIDISIAELQLENRGKNVPFASTLTSIELKECVLILNTSTIGGEDYSPKTQRGFLRSPDCDPPSPMIVLEHLVREIRVFTTSDLSDTYPAGSEITELFVTTLLNVNPDSEKAEIIQFDQIELDIFNEYVVQRTSQLRFRNQEPFRFYGLSLKDNALKVDQIDIVLRVVLILDDIERVEAIGEEIRLKSEEGAYSVKLP